MSRKVTALVKSKSVENERIQILMIAPEYNIECSGNHDNQPVICKLRHPKSSQATLYMFTHENRKLSELVVFEEKCQSWFIGDTVQKDGSLYIASSVDPLFLILPYLASAFKSSKFMQLECVLEDPSFPETKRLSFCQLDDIELVADVKEITGSCFYRFNKDKTLSWLQLKLDRLVKTLKQDNVDVSNGALLSTFTRSNKTSLANTQDEYLRYASGIIADYLDNELTTDFFKYLGISAEETVTVEDASAVPPEAKRMKLDIPNPTEDYSSPKICTTKKVEKLTVAQKQLNKVDKAGMKSISSFFSSKGNKK